MACSQCVSDCRCSVVAADSSVTVTGVGSASNPYQISADICAGLVAISGTNREIDSEIDRAVVINGSGACELVVVTGVGGGVESDSVGFAFYDSGWPSRPVFDTVFWISTDRDAAAPVAAIGTDIVILPPPLEVWEFALSDETTAITTGTEKLTWRTPAAITITGVRASLSTASSSGIPTVDINDSGSSILSTKLTIDATEKTSTTASVPAVISDTALADDAEITFDIDVAGTNAKGLKVKIYGYRT